MRIIIRTCCKIKKELTNEAYFLGFFSGYLYNTVRFG